MTIKKKIQRRHHRRIIERVEHANTWLELVTKIVDELGKPGVLHIIAATFALAFSQLLPTGEPALVWSEIRTVIMGQTSAEPK